MIFALSPGAAHQQTCIGAEQSPVHVIDAASADPQGLIDSAAAQAFGPIGAYYPGVRAALDDDFRTSLTGTLSPILSDHFGLSAQRYDGECFFSLATTPPAALAPIQRLPHYDGLEAERIAVLLFLCPNRFGGTNFFRHKKTGFETVSRERFGDYKNALEDDVRQFGLPPARYIDDGAPIFDRIAQFECVFNRMLIYHGNSLHCSAIPDASHLSDDPRSGRLTINAFLFPKTR